MCQVDKQNEEACSIGFFIKTCMYVKEPEGMLERHKKNNNMMNSIQYKYISTL